MATNPDALNAEIDKLRVESEKVRAEIVAWREKIDVFEAGRPLRSLSASEQNTYSRLLETLNGLQNVQARLLEKENLLLEQLSTADISAGKRPLRHCMSSPCSFMHTNISVF